MNAPQRPDRRRWLAAGGLVLACPWPAAWAHATPPQELRKELPDARLQGAAQLSFLGLPVYDIRMWTLPGETPETLATSWDRPLALELQYARALKGASIAERSLQEMRRVGSFTDEQAERWLQVMRGVFPDVGKGDRLTGVQRPMQAARFFFNGGFAGEVADAEFTRLFFGIWLSARTSQPSLRARLLGGPP